MVEKVSPSDCPVPVLRGDYPLPYSRNVQHICISLTNLHVFYTLICSAFSTDYISERFAHWRVSLPHGFGQLSWSLVECCDGPYLISPFSIDI